MLIDRDLVIEKREQKLIEDLKGGEDLGELKRKHRLDFDLIEAHADEYLIEETRGAHRRGNKVIIDTQLPIHSLNKEETLHVLVYTPLEVLIERDEQRSQRLNRNEKRRYDARAFLLENFASLYDLEQVKRAEKELDRVCVNSLKENIFPFLKISLIDHFFGPHWHEDGLVYLYPKEAPDTIVESHLRTVEESVQSFKLLYEERSSALRGKGGKMLSHN